MYPLCVCMRVPSCSTQLQLEMHVDPHFWHIQAVRKVLHSTAVRWKSYPCIWWFLWPAEGLHGLSIAWENALTSLCYNKTHSNSLKALLDEIRTAIAIEINAFSFSLRLWDASFSQQVCFCLCKCDTIWGTPTNRLDKQHAGYLKYTQQRTFLFRLSSL